MDKDLRIVCRRRRRNWIAVMAALSFTGYTSYRVYHSASVARKRAQISKFFRALSYAAEAFSNSAESVATVSRDLNEFLRSDSDQIPHSFKQLTKLAQSTEFSDSLTRLTQAMILGALRSYDQTESSSFTDRIMEKLCTESGSGFVSTVVGSFARNLVTAIFSMEQWKSASFEDFGKWVNVACDPKCRELIGEVIQSFVTSAVTVYLEKTAEINTFDQIFSGLTNRKNEKEIRELLVSLSNGAVKTLIKTSHQVLSGHGNRALEAGPGSKKTEEVEERELGSKPMDQFGKKPRNGGWTSKNRKALLNLSGRMTFEMIKSFLEVLMEKIYEGMKRCVDIVNEEVIETGLEMVKYAAAKTSVIAAVCLSLCFHVLDSSSWILLPF